MEQRARGLGVSVDPLRVREARQAAGLSLAQVAGTDVSRTFLHLVEQGRARPSQRVLALIARRTRRPIGFFLRQPGKQPESANELAADLAGVATRLRRMVAITKLTKTEREALKLIEVALRQGATLMRAIPRQDSD